MAEGLVVTAIQKPSYEDWEDDLNDRLDQLEAEGRLDEIRAILDGKRPRVQTFAGATIREEDF